MFFEKLGFSSPWYLLLLMILPVIWWLSYRSLSGLGFTRRWTAIVFRTVLISAIVFALAGIQWRQQSDRVSVFYLLDQSESVPADKRKLMLDYVCAEVEKHRRADDRAGVIIFGGNAKVEFPAIDSLIPNLGRFESSLDLRENSTNLEAALKLAKASFPDDSAKRVVILTDGNQNVGDALQAAQELSNDSVGIDIVPVQLLWDQDVSVDRVSLPANLRKGQNFEIRTVLTNHPPTKNPESAKPISGKLRIIKRVGRVGAAADSEILSESPVTLEPGANVYSIPQKAEESALVNVEALFTPDEGQVDDSVQNNQAAAFTNIQGEGRALLIEDSAFPGEFDTLVKVLRRNDIGVDIISTDALFGTLDELVPYDLVILANVPRSGGEDAESGFSFSEDQIEMLVANTERMGSGLLMLGGDRSFGVGGWNDTRLEDALPIEFEIRNDKVAASGALVLLMHACETADGNHWQKVIAQEAIKVLGPIDYCGLLRWDNVRGVDNWLWKLPNGVDKVSPINKNRMLGLLGRMNAGDMPTFDPAMQKGLQALINVPAAAKQMIIISDGDPSAPSNALVQKYKQNQIIISTVAVGSHGPAGHQTMRKLAQTTGGRYYVVKNNRALPRIFQREARRVTKPLIFEPEGGIKAIRMPAGNFHPMLRDVDTDSLPNYKGYVYTTKRESELVEQLLIASQPDDQGENSTLLSTWQYGLGRSTVFTSDAGHRWTGSWIDTDVYEKLFTQMAKQTMRNVSKDGEFQLATQQRDGKTEILVTAADKEGTFLNDLSMQTSVMTPEGSQELKFEQTAPGRYTASFASTLPGNYVLSVFPDEGYRRLTAGIVIQKSSEYNERETNDALLGQLAALKPADGEEGRMIGSDLSATTLQDLLQVDTFASTLKKAIRFSDIWPWVVVLASLVLFGDVFNRRVALDPTPAFTWMGTQWKRLRGRDDAEQITNPMDRLKAKKQDVEQERSQLGKRFVYDESAPISQQSVIDIVRSEIDKSKVKPEADAPGLKQEEPGPSYTDRLLEAKKRARSSQDREDNQ